MTPKEKADELIEKYKVFMYPFHEEVAKNQAIKCALIAVDEILSEASDQHFTIGRNQLTNKDFWQEVKQELIKQQS